MIALLNYCSHDRDLALNLLRWIGEIGGVSRHAIVLQSSQQVLREGGDVELHEEAGKHFGRVESFTPFTEDERGWPQSPNHGWFNAQQHMREMFAGLKEGTTVPGWLYLEPDCVPVPGPANWMDALESAYKEALKEKRGFLAAEVTTPRRRLSGIAVYPAVVSRFLRHRRLGDLEERSARGDAWDVYYSPEWMEFTQFTPLIQNVHFQSKDPDIAPTFPDEESLALLSPSAVLFHRCKDGTLIDRLRLRIQKPEPVEKQNPTQGPVYTPPSAPEPTMDADKELLRARVKELEAKLAVTVTHVGGNGFGGKKKKVRTLEQIAKDKERMARVREARLSKQSPV